MCSLYRSYLHRFWVSSTMTGCMSMNLFKPSLRAFFLQWLFILSVRECFIFSPNQDERVSFSSQGNQLFHVAVCYRAGNGLLKLFICKTAAISFHLPSSQTWQELYLVLLCLVVVLILKQTTRMTEEFTQNTANKIPKMRIYFLN